MTADNPGESGLVLQTFALKQMKSDSGLEALKQDFAKSDKDPDLRRTAMDALKGHLELLDMKVKPDFSDQVSESREVEASRHYAISLYSEVAKVHKHEVIPFVPRIMASVVRSLPSSGGSQQLQQACAKVVTSVARYTIDPSKAPSLNEEILRSLCLPLLLELSSKSEPLAVGAAVCLQALVESEKWKCASLDLQDLVCAKGTSALAEKATQTVAHMHLMRSLAKFNSCVVQQYGAELLRAGMDILQAALGISSSWNQRIAAVQLLGAVLKIADAETLDLDLSPIVGILEGCQLDKVAGVRTVAGDALETAKIVAAEVDLRDEISSEDATPEGAKLLLSKNHIKRTSSMMEEPNVQKFLVLSDTASPNSGTSSYGTLFNTTPSPENFGKCPKRSPLFPVKQSPGKPTCTSRGTRGSFKSSKFKENTPAGNPRGGFAELPASFRIRNDSRDLSHVRMSKELAPMHQDGNNLKNFVDDSGVINGSKSLRVSYSGAKIEGEDPSAQGLHDKVVENQNNGVEDQFCTGTIRRSTMGRKHGIGRQNSLDDVEHIRSPDFAKKSRGNMENGIWNMMACTKEISGKEQPCKDGNVFGEFENCKDGSRGSNRSVRLVEDMLCNGCTDHLVTPDSMHSVTSELTVNSENGDHIQMAQSLMNAEDGHLYATPRRLVHSLRSDGILAKSKGASGVNPKDCLDVNIEALSETSSNTRENLVLGESEDDRFDDNVNIHTVSQNNTSTAGSSCCSSEESDSNIGRHVRACMQSEEQSLWRNNNDCKCLSALLDSLNVEAGKQCQLSLQERAKDLSDVDRNEKIGGMQSIHDDFRVNDEESSLLKVHEGQVESGSVEETMWCVMLKVLRKAQCLTGTSPGFVVRAIVILIVANIVIRFLSNAQDLHVLVPT